MATIKTDFSIFSDVRLLVKTSRIISSMTRNTHFPQQVPPLSDVKDAYETFETAMALRGQGNKDATMVKNKTRRTLERLLRQLALYIQLQSNGDRVMLESTGYEIAYEGSYITVLHNPSNFTTIPAA